MRVFLDTSLLSDLRLADLSMEIAQSRLSGTEFYISVISHFQIMWGYSIAGREPDKYMKFIKKAAVEIAPLTKLDAEEAAQMKPTRRDLLDALISTTVKRYDASIWTLDHDFLRFLPEGRVRLIL